VFGKSLLPFVYKLKIEIPYNKSVADNIQEKRICCSDTVGVAHTTDGKGGFERSTSLNMDNADAVIIADDSTLNMDNNTGVILRHIASRIDCKKIFFALTFFDDFNKEEFDQDEDLDEQKMDYLSGIQMERVTEYLEGSNDSKIINERHLANRNTFYLKGLAKYATPDMDAINGMLDIIRQETEIARSPSGVSKANTHDPIATYDFRKLPLYYAKAQSKFMTWQDEVYMGVDRPHFKTTEALTRRLSIKEPLFIGAKKLTPVDDFFNAIAVELSDYISNPESTNLVGDSDRIQQVIQRLKTVITEHTRQLAHLRFFSDTRIYEWKGLYDLQGVGSDAVRRNGIIKVEEKIAPSELDFLSQKGHNHAIDELQEIFDKSIQQVEEELFGLKSQESIMRCNK
jgi:hypothetical protein